MRLGGNAHTSNGHRNCLQGDLLGEIYLEQLEAFEVQGQEEKVCLLKRPLYDLKQAGRCWYEKLDTYLEKKYEHGK